MKLTTRLVALFALIAAVAIGSLTSVPGVVEAQIPGDLAVTKTGPATVSPGGTITYTITISNVGIGPREMISFTDTLPTNVTFVSWTQTSGPVFTTATVGAPVTAVTANRVLALNGGESAVFSLVVTANAGLASGTVITNPGVANACQVTSTSTAFPENNTAPNNFCTASTTVQFVVPTITKSFTPASIQVNAQSLLTIVVGNPNTFTLTNVSFTDTLPAGVTVVAGAPITNGGTAFAICGSAGAGGGGTLTATGNTISLTGNTRTAGSSCAIGVMVTSAAAGTYPNTTGQVTSNEVPPGGPANATLTVTALPPAPTPVPPATPTATPPPVVLIVPPVIPQVFQHVPQGIFNGSRNNTPTPVVRAAVAPVVVDPMPALRPPNTGDAGLEQGSGGRSYVPFIAIVAVLVVSAGAAWRWKRR